MAERDRRLVREYAMWRHPEMVTHAYRDTLLEFSADVWAAKVLLEHQYGVGRAAPTKIVRWLVAHGRTHCCQENSLRTMVYRAFQKNADWKLSPTSMKKRNPCGSRFPRSSTGAVRNALKSRVFVV